MGTRYRLVRAQHLANRKYRGMVISGSSWELSSILADSARRSADLKAAKVVGSYTGPDTSSARAKAELWVKVSDPAKLAVF